MKKPITNSVAALFAGFTRLTWAMVCIAMLCSTTVWAQGAPPTVSITGPANNGSYVAPASFTLSASAVAYSGNSVRDVNWYINGAYAGDSLDRKSVV